MKSRHGRIGIVLIATVLTSAALAGGALTAFAAQSTILPTKIAVREVNYKILLKKHTFKVGKAVFVVHNASNALHEFKIKGPGVSKLIPSIPPGVTKKLRVTLTKGKYVLSCPLHLALGMKTVIFVGSTKMSGGTG